MQYTSEDLEFIRGEITKSSSKHVKLLGQMLEQNMPYVELFAYGTQYLPRFNAKQTGKIDLNILQDYVPQIVEYFDVLSEIPSLPEALKEVATDLAIYADGEAVQTDEYYLNYDVESKIKDALKNLPKP